MSKIDLEKSIKRIESLAIFRDLLNDIVIKKLYDFLLKPDVLSYGSFVSELYNSKYASLGGYIWHICEESENIYVQMVGNGDSIPLHLKQSLVSELDTLQSLADITAKELKELIGENDFLPEFSAEKLDIKQEYMNRVKNIQKYGYGIFANHYMFYLDDSGKIIPVIHPDKTRLSDLVDYASERNAVIENTKALLLNKPAANVLLTGDAGTGKSSTIKAIVNELYVEGLRIIEVRKEQLRLIHKVLDDLASNPLKFIIFIDDLSFSSDDDNFNALKAVLEGSVSAKSKNVVIYATGNRRHIIKEKFSDREGDDIHFNDTMQELVSLSERFGIHITFQKPNKITFLNIVRRLAEQNNLNISTVELEAKAEQFALRRGGRSARLAKQLIDELISSQD